MLYRPLRWLMPVTLTVIGLWPFALFFGLQGDTVVLYLLPSLLYAVSIGMLASLGNALGKFGFKYAVPPLILPFLGLILSFMRVRDHLRRARARDGHP